MKIAVTYNKEDNSIWQHFGRTEAFKMFTVEDEKIVSSEVIDSTCGGHGALAPFLKELGTDVVICGGLGSPMVAAIESLGMELVPGVSGDADEAVQYYLDGELESNAGAVHEGCHHHGEVEHSCGCHGDNSGEGHSCGCHREPIGNEGKTCKVHYTGTFNNGEKFDSSYDRGETLEFICGAGMMIKGFDEAVRDMQVGEKVKIHLMPEDAYGMPDPDAIFTAEISELPGSEDLEVGQQVYLTNQFGQPFPVMVIAKTEETITFDANHEMAGKELNFEIELVEIC